MYTFYIETNSIEVIKKMEGLNINNEHQTPYQNYFCCFEVQVLEKDLLLFMDKIKKLRKKCALKTYIKRENKYEPFIMLDKNNELLYTTFFYKSLNNPSFNGEKNDGSVLENLDISKSEQDYIRGFYRCTKWSEDQTRVVNEHTGEFQLSKESDGKSSIVHIFRQNHHITNEQPSIYDKILPAPWNQKIKDIETKEYYIHFTEDIILHFADEKEIIEAYVKSRDGMSNIPYRIFNKNSENLSKVEQEMVLAVENYQKYLSEQIERKRA